MSSELWAAMDRLEALLLAQLALTNGWRFGHLAAVHSWYTATATEATVMPRPPLSSAAASTCPSPPPPMSPSQAVVIVLTMLAMVFVILPTLHHADCVLKRTRGLILLVPDHIIRATPSMLKLMSEYTAGPK